MSNFMSEMFGKLAPEMCRLSMTGGIAVKTKNGYKTFDVASGQLTNCDNFVFSVGDEFFFVIPAKKVKPGDIILVGGLPKCVIKAEKNLITVMNYEDSTIENIVPERHIFMGNTFMFRKIVSMFGNDFGKGKKGPGKIMKYMMLNEMMKGSSNESKGGMSAILPMMLLGGKTNDLFGEMFDFEDDEDEEDGEN